MFFLNFLLPFSSGLLTIILMQKINIGFGIGLGILAWVVWDGLFHQPKDNTYILRWSDEDKVYIAYDVKYPTVKAHGETEDEAILNVHEAVKLIKGVS